MIVGEVIAYATKDCPREDCVVSCGAMMTTCMTWSESYDKAGNRIDAGDPNTTTTSMACSTCGTRWWASTQRGQTFLAKVLDQPKPVDLSGLSYTVGG